MDTPPSPDIFNHTHTVVKNAGITGEDSSSKDNEKKRMSVGELFIFSTNIVFVLSVRQFPVSIVRFHS
jgi:hypothetical protein